MKKFLNPILDKDEYFHGVQKELEYYLYDLVYKRLVDFLRENLQIKIQNAKTTSLKTALRNNKVTYLDGYFIGKFNSSISKDLIKIGAEWKTRKKGYKIDLINIPIDIREAIATGAAKLAAEKAQISKILVETEATAAQLTFKFNFEQQMELVFKNLNMQFVKTAAGNITVTPEMTRGIQKALMEKYNTNMDLYVKEWQESAIIRLRTKVEKHVFEGFRADTLERIIVNEFQSSRKKAKFLAMQETSLLVSKFREERYKGAGVGKYKWSTSGDTRVRDSHKKLNGKVFSWDSPPVTNDQGDRNNPGEDYGCRCVPIPIVD
ncbi:minor capsid protein [Candidatus Pacearchaeota archaeon]|nr:minor capsid protein [Candidatus Pacearchaeota archaeon]